MKEMILFEWLPFKKRGSFYLLILLFFSVGLFTAKGANFPFPGVHRNSPYITSFVIALFSQISIFSVTILSAQILLREQDANFQQVLYAAPLKKILFLLSRFVLIATISVLLFFFLVAGLMTGHAIPWIPADELGNFNAWHYIQPFLLFALPNTILCTTIICLLGWISKSRLMIYLSGLLVYVLYIVVAIFSNSPLMATASPASDEAMSIAARIDPFGLAALFEQTKYWSPLQRNTELLSLSGNLLFNRFLWTFSSVCFLIIGIRSFKLKISSAQKRKNIKENVNQFFAKEIADVQAYPGSRQHSFQTITSFARIDLKSIVKGIPFVLLCLVWIFLLGMEIFGTIEAGVRLPERYATTGLMLNTILKTMPFFCLMAILFYSNELIWRSRNANIASLENSTPAKEVMIFISKLISLSVIPLLMIVLSIVTGIVFQLMYQYPVIDLKIYFSLFYLIGLPMICCLSIIMSIQMLFKNKFLGIAVAALFVLLSHTSLGQMIGLKNPLFRIGNSYDQLYSEMNGFGGYLVSFSWNVWYAAAIAILFVLLAVNVRKQEMSFSFEKLFLTRPVLTALVIAAIPASYIFFQNNILYPKPGKTEQTNWKRDYELLYRKFESMPQPVINYVQTEIDLYPNEQRYRVKGTYWLQNKTALPMDSMLIYFSNDCNLERIDIAGAALSKKDEKFGHYFYRFNRALEPNDSFKINFQFSYGWTGFKGHQSFNAIVDNGSFMRISNYFPRLGYQADNEIDNEQTRKERNMGAASTLAEPEDSTGNNDFILLDMQVSTSAGQTAIGVGELVKQWQKDGRNYFKYSTGQAIPFRFAVSSAGYAVKKDSYHGKPFEVYYLPAHAENIDSLIVSAKRTLAYGEKNFSPYPFKSIRFAEISSFTKGFAGTAYPATIFMTEDMVFHTNIRKSKTTNIIGELAAHELAHQWWGGNLLQPANKKGRSFLTEALAMYTELMLNQQVADSTSILTLLKMYKDFYFSERIYSKESPLYKAMPGDTYLNYYKGVVAMYQLQLLLGEEKLNLVLRSLLSKHAYPLSPAGTTDLLHELYAVSTNAQHKYINDLFKNIITHDIKINAASVKTVAGNNFELSYDITILKYNDLNGKKLIQQYNDSIDIAFYKEQVKEVRRLPVNNNKVSGKMLFPYKIDRIAIDPYMKLMDAFDDDNAKALKKTEAQRIMMTMNAALLYSI